MLITRADVARARRTLFRDDDADADLNEQGLGHPDRRVDFTIRPVSAEWRLVGRKPAYRTARANVQYIWRDGAGHDRFGAMPRWFGERTYDLRASGLLLPASAPQWAAAGYELWDRIDTATAATGDPTEVSAWHILAEMPKGLDARWWEWLAVTFAERNLVRLGEGHRLRRPCAGCGRQRLGDRAPCPHGRARAQVSVGHAPRSAHAVLGRMLGQS